MRMGVDGKEALLGGSARLLWLRGKKESLGELKDSSKEG